MKKLFFSMLLSILFMGTAIDLFAQYEQKFTLNGAIGFAQPVGKKTYEAFGMEMPTLFSNFAIGTSITGGIQYNHSRRFSIAGNVGYKSQWGWYFEDMEIDDIAVWNLHFGVAPKIYLTTGGNINPYVFTELSLNYTSIYVGEGEEIMSVDEGYPSIGVYPGIGFDLKVSNNFGLFAQTGFNIVMINEDFSGVDYYENYSTILLELGIKLSLFKSKKI